MPLFGVKCAICGKTRKPQDFVLDAESGNYYCCQEHLDKARELGALVRKAHEKGLVLCDNCLKGIDPDAYACKYCGRIRVVMKGYSLGGMCPFTVVQVGSTRFGEGEYYWQHSACIREYCALLHSAMTNALFCQSLNRMAVLARLSKRLRFNWLSISGHAFVRLRRDFNQELPK